MLCKTEWSWELRTWSHKTNFLDILTTSPHYFCRKWTGATSENSNFDLTFQLELKDLPFMSSSSSSLLSGTGGGPASFRSYFPSLPMRYELVLPVSHWIRTQPSSPSSPITRPSLGGGPSCEKQRAALFTFSWNNHLEKPLGVYLRTSISLRVWQNRRISRFVLRGNSTGELSATAKTTERSKPKSNRFNKQHKNSERTVHFSADFFAVTARLAWSTLIGMAYRGSTYAELFSVRLIIS